MHSGSEGHPTVCEAVCVCGEGLSLRYQTPGRNVQQTTAEDEEKVRGRGGDSQHAAAAPDIAAVHPECQHVRGP